MAVAICPSGLVLRRRQINTRLKNSADGAVDQDDSAEKAFFLDVMLDVRPDFFFYNPRHR
jgi:hypothetical protein